MTHHLRRAVLTAAVALATSQAIAASAEDKIEGTVVRTKLTSCDMATHRCEGSLELQTSKADKGEPVSIRVVADTTIKKGSEKMYLPALRKNFVSVSYVTEKGEKLAKAIEVVPERSRP